MYSICWQVRRWAFVWAVLFASALWVTEVRADPAAEIDSAVDEALTSLLKEDPGAAAIAEKSKGVLVFPSILKAGLLIGGQYGEGALRIDGATKGFYSTVAISYGLQAGGQQFGYAMFLMTDEALSYLESSDGWEVGVGPSIVVVDKGAGMSTTTTTVKSDVYAYIFNQEGLMAGLGLQGSKISPIER
jgi:lipid-binding SYLF domain-containing protein